MFIWHLQNKKFSYFQNSYLQMRIICVTGFIAKFSDLDFSIKSMCSLNSDGFYIDIWLYIDIYAQTV